MKSYLVTYDLNTPGKNYYGLINKIQEFSNVKICESAWIINTSTSCSFIRDYLSPFLDYNDSIFVARLSGEAAWKNCKSNNDSIRNHLR